jgi:hypothetical protein
MAIECEKTAANVHANSYSIVAAVAGFIAAIAIFAVLLFFLYDGRNSIAPTAQSEGGARPRQFATLDFAFANPIAGVEAVSLKIERPDMAREHARKRLRYPSFPSSDGLRRREP